jgi:uncharacterized coiled-coil DUF342 family protein
MDAESIVKEFGEIKRICTEINTKLDFYKKDVDEAHRKIRETENQIEALETQITSFKGAIKGAYLVLGVAVSVLLAVLARTGVLTRVFGG